MLPANLSTAVVVTVTTCGLSGASAFGSISNSAAAIRTFCAASKVKPVLPATLSAAGFSSHLKPLQVRDCLARQRCCPAFQLQPHRQPSRAPTAGGRPCDRDQDVVVLARTARAANRLEVVALRLLQRGASTSPGVRPLSAALEPLVVPVTPPRNCAHWGSSPARVLASGPGQTARASRRRCTRRRAGQDLHNWLRLLEAQEEACTTSLGWWIDPCVALG